eukprot:CAMPEP_0115865102 /NCGR_PEP_ID=MMETSP0287-20121206/19544_1 /TAXON_ID=412157 /ORGANISM="Chrysochromulina rotalis, Strain UIO044" /LENGTH=276 /DNA_ID=CAMNT_0003319595 /DNA_START=68 /DNA_END=898 /DNA_ORIENTATION=-
MAQTGADSGVNSETTEGVDAKSTTATIPNARDTPAISARRNLRQEDVGSLTAQFQALRVPAATCLEECALILYDLETTGLSSKADSIVEIAAHTVLYRDGNWVTHREPFQTLANPGRPIPATAVSVHGITDDMVASAPSIAQALTAFSEYISGTAPQSTIMMAHNGMRFDRHFIRNADPSFGPAHVAWWADSVSLFKLLSPGKFDSYKLTKLYGDLDGPPEQAHRALADVRMMKHVLSSLWRTRSRGFDSCLTILHRTTRAPDANLRNRTLFALRD